MDKKKYSKEDDIEFFKMGVKDHNIYSYYLNSTDLDNLYEYLSYKQKSHSSQNGFIISIKNTSYFKVRLISISSKDSITSPTCMSL